MTLLCDCNNFSSLRASVYGLFFGPFHGRVDGETNDEAEESVEHAEHRGAALLLHLGRTCNITLTVI